MVRLNIPNAAAAFCIPHFYFSYWSGDECTLKCLCFSFVFIMLLVYINMLFLVVLHHMWPIMYQSLLLLRYSALWLMFLHCFV